MKKVFLDTNIVLDYLLYRSPYILNALRLFNVCREHQILLYVSSLSFSNMAYILRKEITRSEIYSCFSDFRRMAKVSMVSEKEVDKALMLHARDFEDALQYFSALSAGADCIVTRNVRDYPFAEIPILTPPQFLAEFDK